MKDPVAIIGIGCRFPGADDPHAFWQLLRSGQSAIREVPADRWDIDKLYHPNLMQPGKVISRWGGFLDQIDQFDWRAFRMLPREAQHMDPQQRLLLEITWEALEDAGLLFSEIAGSRTGVFVGIGWSDYLRLQAQNWSELNGYTAPGNASGFAANRLSYAFDLCGPSMALDASCTSSLNALYVACQSLWAEEADLALVGGVSLQISPDNAIMVSKAGLLAPDGRCKTLDASADGFVTGEGAGMIVLKRLSQVRPEDRVYALLLDIASSHNGHNEWIMAPSQAAQEMLLRASYRKAEVDPGEIDYVELHGTGFRRGDAIEAQALGTVLGISSERQRPCMIGSVKTNIGHLGVAAGIASTIKVALALFHQEIPPTLNIQTLNPDIPLHDLCLDVPRTAMPWPEKETPALAGISSFSLSGANAHAVLASAPRSAVPQHTNGHDEENRPFILPLSAPTAHGLRLSATAFKDFLDRTDAGQASWHNICYTASTRRAHWTSRLAVVGRTRCEVSHVLDDFLQGRSAKGLFVADTKAPLSQQCIFVFPDQWPCQINAYIPSLQKERTFRLVIEQCERFAQIYANYSILAELEQASALQPLNPVTLFALQIALMELWRSWGIVPDAALGEGWGELAAAYTLGTVTLEDALKTIIQAKFAHSQASVSEEKFSQILLAKDSCLLLELGPHSGLGDALMARAYQHNRQTLLFSSLDSTQAPQEVWLETLAGLYTQGSAVNWSNLYKTPYQCTSLPCFPWQRERLWIEWLDFNGISTPPESKVAHLPTYEEVASTPEIAWSQLPLEEALAKIWADVLGLEHVGQNESFFGLGGHSLLAAQLITWVRDRLQIELSLNTLFKASTPAACADLIRQHTASEAEPLSIAYPSVVSDPAQRFTPFMTTDVQQAYWVGRNMAEAPFNVGNHAYIEVVAPLLDIQRFNSAMQRLIERHEMLRAIMLPDGQQQILPKVPPFAATCVDLRGQDQQKVTAKLQQMRLEMDHQLLPIEQWPAFDLRIVLLDGSQTQIHLSVESLFVDAWSMHLLVQEFIQLYNNLAIHLPPLELSFRDYLLTEQTLHDTDFYQRAEQYWLKRLFSLPPAPDLPVVPLSASQQPHFVHYEGRLEKELWKRLKVRGAQAELTPSGILLAAFAEVLRTWSKNPHFSLNLSIFNRLPLHPQVNQIVGDFTSLIVLAIEDATGTFEHRARSIQEQMWRDLDYSVYSGVQVLRELGRRQSNIATGVMPIVFTSLLIEDMANQFSPPWQETLYCVSQTPQVWLDHQVLESDGTLIFHWQVVESLFPAGVIDAMFSAYTQLLQCLAMEEHVWQANLIPLLPAQQRALYEHTNATDGPPESPCLLQQLFTRQVCKDPKQLAIITPQRTLSYAEVHTGSLLLAYQLRQLGAKPNQLVGIVMEKGWEQIVAALGVLLSGAAYLPIDAQTPETRLHYLLEHSNVNIVLTQSLLAQQIHWPANIQCIYVDTLELQQTAAPELEAIQTPEDLAYVIYTSGSTGLPKGVMIDHRAAVNTVVDINERFQVGPQDRVLALSAFTFDLSVYDIFGLLAAGGTIVMPTNEAVRDPLAWLEVIIKERITIWNTVPALLQILLEFAEEQAQTLSLGNSLRLTLLSGDWIPLSLPGHLKKFLPDIEMISLGGATEASIWSIFYPIHKIDPSWKSIPYGYPLRNQRFYVLNEVLEACPLWVTGDLYIGGMGLSRGYWGDEEKTQASFLLHPRTGERLYKTGDLGRYLPDGTIEFLGREDFQVKIQGYRIELGEIEAALARHPNIQEAIVTSAGEAHGEKYLVAYIVLQSASSLKASELRTFLAERLPGYMVPSTFLFLEKLPLTSNGKVDRKALPLPARQDMGVDQHETSLEETALVAQIRQILMRLLKIEHIDPHTNLLEYGATSLDMLRLANQLHNRFHVRLYAGQLYRYATLATLAQYCEQMSGENSEGNDTPDTTTQAPEEVAVSTVVEEITEWEEGIV